MEWKKLEHFNHNQVPSGSNKRKDWKEEKLMLFIFQKPTSYLNAWFSESFTQITIASKYDNLFKSLLSIFFFHAIDLI